VTLFLRIQGSSIELSDQGSVVARRELGMDATVEHWTDALGHLAESVTRASWSTLVVEPCGGLVALGADGVAVRSPILPADERSAPDSGWCLKKFDAPWWESHTGGQPTPDRTVCKLSWLHRSEADAWSAMARACTVSDWLRWRIIGGAPDVDRLVTDSGTAPHTGLWNPAEGRYSDETCRLIDADRDWSSVLPRLRA